MPERVGLESLVLKAEASMLPTAMVVANGAAEAAIGILAMATMASTVRARRNVILRIVADNGLEGGDIIAHDVAVGAGKQYNAAVYVDVGCGCDRCLPGV